MNSSFKQVISHAELLTKIQEIIDCFPECTNVQVDGIRVYREHVDGANWHINNFSCAEGDDCELSKCKGKIMSEILSLRAYYDVG